MRISKPYQYLEHMTDAYIEASGRSLEDAYANAALALVETMFHLEDAEPTFEEVFEVEGSDLENLLYNWLEAVLLKALVEGKIFSQFQVDLKRIDHEGYRIKARVRGEEFKVEKHRPKVEVKAVTYHLMQIIEQESRVKVRFLLDL